MVFLISAGRPPSPKKAGRRAGLGSSASNRDGPLGLDRGRDDVLHGLFGLDPRSARARPAGPGVERDLEAEALGLPDDVLEQAAPLRGS